MAKSLQKKHWLVHVLRRADLPGAADLAIDPGTPPAEAWETACETLDLSLDELAGHVADYFRLRVARLENAEPTALKLVPEKIARQYSVFPVKEDDRHLTVATSDPTDFAAEQALGFISGRKTVFEVAPPPFILDFLNASYSPDGAIETLLDRVDDAVADAVALVREEEPVEEVTEADTQAAPVIKLTNLIFRDAIQNGASDIHIEPGASGGVVRFRIDGVLRNYMQLPLPALVRIVSRIKIMGNLDIANKWRPQDGRTRVVVEGRPYDIRISTVPTRGAEKVVLRVLKGGEAARLNEIGLPPWELGRLRQLLSFRDGIVCVTGPTGSGKTTTLYAGIRELATGEVNIMTVEDPVEYELSGITQIQVQPKRGVTFASALRAILRQDPDVILVGEIRDLETAEVAVQAAMTGHLVLATLHTNDAVSAVARLLDIGLDAPSIASTLRGALAQRLVRKVCDECGEPIRGEMTAEEARLAKLYNFRPPIRSVGCRRCAETGYRGRTPIQEVFLVNTHIADMITAGASHSELYDAAVSAGMRPLLQVGLDRVRSGDTTLEELERVLGTEADEREAAGRRGAGEPAGAPEGPSTAVGAEPEGPEAPDAGTPEEVAAAPDAGPPAEEESDPLAGIGAGLELKDLDEPVVPTGAGTGELAGPPGDEPQDPRFWMDRRELGESLVPGGPEGPGREGAGGGEDLTAIPGLELADGTVAEGSPGRARDEPGAGGSAEGPAGAEPVELAEPEETAEELVAAASSPGAGRGRGSEPGAPGRDAAGTGMAASPSNGDAPVLVVDDDPEDRLLLRTLLAKHGFTVQEAQDGEEALEMIAGGPHSLVVLDLEMPVLDGREVLERLRASPRTAALPVVVLTASADVEDEYRLMEGGADDYLRKPLDPPRFIARVRAALRRARMS